MTAIDWIVIVLYSISLLVMGAVFSRRTRSSSEMFAAGRQSPWWLSGVSAYMTMFSAGTFVVWGGIAFERGLVAIMISMSYGFAAFGAGLLFAARWRRTGLNTAAEFIQLRYGTAAFHFYTWFKLFLSFSFGLMVYGLAVMLCPLMQLPEDAWLRDDVTGHLSVDWACVILVGIVCVYTMTGGLWAVLMTDMLQFLVLTLGVAITIPLLLPRVGGIEQFIRDAPQGFLAPTSGDFTWYFIVGWMLVNMFQIGAEWAFIQRHLCVPSPRDARRACYLFGALYLVTPVLWMTPPMLYRMIDPAANREQAYILACQSVLPPGTLGLMMAAMFSATASSMSSQLNVYASVLTDDVYRKLLRPEATERQLVRAGRGFTLLIAIWMLAGALILPRLTPYQDFVILMGSITGGALLLPTLWGLWSQRVGIGAVWYTLGVTLVVVLLLRFGLMQGGWFEDAPWGCAIAQWAQANRRISDLLAGIGTPLLVLVVLELTGRRPQAGWLRLSQASDINAQAQRGAPVTAILPIQAAAWCMGFLCVLMAGLCSVNPGYWRTLGAASLVLGLGGLVAWALARQQTRRAIKALADDQI